MDPQTVDERMDSFEKRLQGRFDGMIRTEFVTRLGDTMANLDGWYLLEADSTLSPEELQPVSGGHARRHLDSLVAEILAEERGVWTTMVYAQSMEDPWIVKVFHPRRAGCGCGGGGGIVPWWVLTRIKPESSPFQPSESCAIPTADGTEKGLKTWLKKLF